MKGKTGRSLEEWTVLLDAEGFRERPHKEIAAYLSSKRGLSPWWSQEVTVQYEKNIGRRITGQTESTGFQLGVSRTLPVPAPQLWRWLISDAGVSWFAGSVPGGYFTLDGVRVSREGIQSELRVLKKDSHLRMRWKLPGWDDFSTLQIRVNPKGGNKATLSIHQEKLSGQKAREDMLIYWKRKIDEIQQETGELL